MNRLLLILISFSVHSCNQGENKTLEQSETFSNHEWTELKRVSKSHLRGLDASNDGIIWASGTEGTVLKSLDSGRSWTKHQIPNCLELDFRDIEAFDQNNAVVISAGNGVKIYRTENGGLDWTLTYESIDSSLFFDGFDFNGNYGLAYGDPIQNKFQILETKDGGYTWKKANLEFMPTTLKGEAGFAASGTGIKLGKSGIWIATGGGTKSRVFRCSADSSWSAVTAPLSSSPSSGIFSIAFTTDKIGIAVGGDYVDSTRSIANAAYTIDGGLNWSEAKSNPSGYRSCVSINKNGIAFATGRTGTDISTDFGRSWSSLSKKGYFSCVALSDYVIGVGRNGKMGWISIPRDSLPLMPE